MRHMVVQAEIVLSRSKTLSDAGFVCTIRQTRGDDIDAACGQLVGQVADRTRRAEQWQKKSHSVKRFCVHKDKLRAGFEYSKVKTVLCMGIAVAFLVSGCQTTHTQKDPEKAVKVRTQLAAEHIRSGDLDSAKRALDQALSVDSRDATANMMMGILLQQEGSKSNLEKAEHYFKEQFHLNRIMLKHIIIMVLIYIKWSVIMMRLSNFVLLAQH